MKHPNTRRSGVKVQRKPSIAKLSEEIAKTNIEAKLQILERLVFESSAHPSSKGQDKNVFPIRRNAFPIGLPRSLRTFNQWQEVLATEEYPWLASVSIHTNSNDTVNRYPGIKERIRVAIKILSDLSKENEFEISAPINKVRRYLKILKVKNFTLENEMLTVSSSLRMAKEKLEKAESRIRTLEEDFRTEVERYEKILNSNSGQSTLKLNAPKLKSVAKNGGEEK